MDRPQETSAAVLTRESTFMSRAVTGQERPDRPRGVHAAQSGPSGAPDMSDDLQGLLTPGRNVILRFESMSAAELKVREDLQCRISSHGQLQAAPTLEVPGCVMPSLACYCQPGCQEKRRPERCHQISVVSRASCQCSTA